MAAPRAASLAFGSDEMGGLVEGRSREGGTAAVRLAEPSAEGGRCEGGEAAPEGAKGSCRCLLFLCRLPARWRAFQEPLIKGAVASPFLLLHAPA